MRRLLADIITRVMLLIAVLCGLTACQSASGSFCTIAPRLYYDQRVYDAMSDREAARHLGYLKTGEKLCGWKP